MPARRTRRTRDKRTVVHILNACFVCGKCFYTPNRLIIHFRKQHSIALFPCKQNARRPESKLFRFESDSKKYYDLGNYGCPSCWFQCQKYRLDTLENHIITEHVAVDAVEEEEYGSQEYNEEEEDEYQIGSSEVEELEGTCDKHPQERIGRKGFESMNFDEEEEADQLESIVQMMSLIQQILKTCNQKPNRKTLVVRSVLSQANKKMRPLYQGISQKIQQLSDIYEHLHRL